MTKNKLEQKTKGFTYYRDKADRVFSKYIRKRDSDWRGYCKCCTCPKILPIKQMQAGHWISRKHLITRYDEHNVHAQCKGCNNKNWGNGESGLHEIHIVDVHGEDARDELLKKLRQSKKTVFKLTVQELKEIIAYYQQQ